MATRGERFRKAFAEAKKRGDEKFYFDGGWYKTELATKTKAKSSTYNVGEYRTRFKKDKDGTINKTITGTKNDKDPITITAGYKKIIRNNKNFLNFVPIDERTDLVDNNGNTRVYYNRNNGMYYVTDNYGYIIGTSNDENAAKNGFYDFVQYGDDKESLRRSGASRINMRANMNEVNQLSRQKEQRAHEELKDDMNRGRAYFANTINGVVNTPNHAVMGALRVANYPTNGYTFNEYIKGFDPNQYYNGSTYQTTGIGDVLELKSEPLRFAANLAGNLYTGKMLMGKDSPRLTEKATPKYSHTRLRETKSGRFTRGKYTYRMPVGNNKHISDMYPNVYVNGRLVSRKQVSPEIVYNNVNAPYTEWVRERSFSPYGTFIERPDYNTQIQEDSPLHRIEYNGGKRNETIYQRMITGDFIPGTTAKDFTNPKFENNVEVISSYGNAMPDLGGFSLTGNRFVSPQGTIQTGSHGNSDKYKK